MSETDTIDTIDTEAAEAERLARNAQAMDDAGLATEESVQADYFGFEETENVALPDGKSYVTIQALNEGARRQYLNKVNREVKIAKQTGDAIMQLANGDERRILLTNAIVGWNLVSRNPKTGEMTPVPCKEPKIYEWLEKANPVIIDIVDKAVRKQNPWLLNEMTIEDLENQIGELQEQLEQKRAEEEGKES